jgi:hypothetical protein
MSERDLPPAESFEPVYAVTDYHDGPLRGVADFGARPHVFQGRLDPDRDEYPRVFELWPIDEDTLRMVREDWEIWRRWEEAFHRGEASRESHPALPQDRARHDALAGPLEERLARPGAGQVLTANGVFRPRQASKDPDELEVHWSRLPGENPPRSVT